MDIFDVIIKHDVCRLCELLSGGGDVNKEEADGITPLHFAVSYKFYEAILLLLKFGADPNIKNADGLTPFDCAVEFKDKTSVSIFRKFSKSD